MGFLYFLFFLRYFNGGRVSNDVSILAIVNGVAKYKIFAIRCPFSKTYPCPEW